MACAMFCNSTVLPVRGGETMSARWPLPIGATISMTRGERSFLVAASGSIVSRSAGLSGGRASELGGGDVDVGRARQVVGFRRAQETEAVGEHFDHALADDVDFATR